MAIGPGPTTLATTKTNTTIASNDVQFSVNSPTNIAADRRVRETFPLRNYVFFNEGSSEIPSRYVLLRKDQVKDLVEDKIEEVKDTVIVDTNSTATAATTEIKTQKTTPIFRICCIRSPGSWM